MKKEVAAFIFSLGGNPAYSGKLRTMFITDPRKDEKVESIEATVATENNVPSKVFVRIESVDKNGKATYSNISIVSMK